MEHESKHDSLLHLVISQTLSPVFFGKPVNITLHAQIIYLNPGTPVRFRLGSCSHF